MKNDTIIFEDYNVIFKDEDFEGVSFNTLEKCKTVIEETLAKF